MKIKIYTTPDCYKCKMIKQALSNRSVEFEESDAIEHYDEIKDCGYLTAPIINYNGTFMDGTEFMEYAMREHII